MAKDPAFLFYYQDFLVGTAFLSNEEVGAYIKILAHLADKTYLSEKHMLNICKRQETWKAIQDKFQKTENGMYYNERLIEEVKKRKKYAESRRNNRKKKDMKNICKTYVPHMENENENINSINVSSNYINIYKEIKEEFELTQKQEELFLTWFRYKSEKKQSYKETGMKALIKRILIETSGNESRIEKMINYSMANNYAGLYEENSNGNNIDKKYGRRRAKGNITKDEFESELREVYEEPYGEGPAIHNE